MAKRTAPGTPTADRLLAKIERVGDCWEWQGWKTNGYGVLDVGRQKKRAHRVAYEIFVGPIPDGLQLDHLCRNRACCNPEHLEPVTARENLRRGYSPPAVTVRTGRCQRGHERSEQNVDRQGHCRPCQNLIRRERYRDDPDSRAATLARKKARYEANRDEINARERERRSRTA